MNLEIIHLMILIGEEGKHRILIGEESENRTQFVVFVNLFARTDKCRWTMIIKQCSH